MTGMGGVMRARTASIVLAFTLCVAVAGCTSHTPPPSYTDDERNAFFEERLDAAWANTDLEGVVGRPDLAAGIGDRFAADNWQSLSECMFETGLTGWGFGESNGGPIFMGNGNDPLPPDLQLAAYICFAENPVTDNYRNILLTDDQKQYLYDYYKRWVVPCLASHRYEFHPDFVPTERHFLENVGDWNPYYAISSGPGYSSEEGLSNDKIDELEALCGSASGGLDVDLTGGFGIGG